MSLYVQRRCWSCEEILEGYTPNYKAIGIPYVQCEYCRTYNRCGHVNEWDLMSFFAKTCYIGVIAWTTILYAMAGPILAYGAAHLFGWEKSNRLFYDSYAVGLVTMIAINIWLFISDVRKSRTRLRDPQYLDKLRELQIIR